jgi:uncharacterized protein YbaR (Trm112 family)
MSLARDAQAFLLDLHAVRRAHRAMRREALAHEPSPPVGGLVLEIGGGQAPHPRADAVVEKYVLDDTERPAGESLSFARPVVVADGEALPFADASFAYSIASHVLEHAKDPTRFAAELARVSAAGFVQVPSRSAELTFGWPFHPWLIDREHGVLEFHPRGSRGAESGDLFHRSFAESRLFRLWWAEHRSRWHHSIEWRGELPVRVDGKPPSVASAHFELDRTIAALTTTAEMGGAAPLGHQVREQLRCPSCRSALDSGTDRLSCAGCGRAYPVAGGVPLLLDAAAL